MSVHRRKWDNTNLIVPFTFLNARLVNHIISPPKSTKLKKCVRSLKRRGSSGQCNGRQWCPSYTGATGCVSFYGTLHITVRISISRVLFSLSVLLDALIRK